MPLLVVEMECAKAQRIAALVLATVALARKPMVIPVLIQANARADIAFTEHAAPLQHIVEMI